MSAFLKYPRTPHLVGSRLQPGDDDLEQVSLDELDGHTVVVEEKLDGSNAGIWFTNDGELRLQSRGHVLRGGPSEWQFAPLKAWAARHRDELWSVLGDRYVCYGEWLFATHTIFYDHLPDYFVEFDVWDRQASAFLDTSRRHELLAPLPVTSAPVLWSGELVQEAHLRSLAVRSRFVTSDPATAFADAAAAAGLGPAAATRRADVSGLAEGLYLKTETDGIVTGRYKWVRPSFSDAVVTAGEHWTELPMIRNRLRSSR